mgnify:CR=1 FL=1
MCILQLPKVQRENSPLNPSLTVNGNNTLPRTKEISNEFDDLIRFRFISFQI